MNLVSKPPLCFSASQKKQSKRLVDSCIWDVDGTLCNTTSLAFNATNDVLERFGLDKISVDQYKFGSRYTTPKRFAFHVSDDEELGKKLARAFNEYYVELVSEETAPLFIGLRELIVRLDNEGVKHAALSNACGEYARRCISANRLDGCFEISLGADEVQKPKPHPDGIVEICKKLELDVSRSCYIGDAPSDGKAARAASCAISIGVNWGSHDLKAKENAGLFDVVVETTDELNAFFEHKILKVE